MDVRRGEPGVDHPERIEDTLAQELLERLTGGACDQHAEDVRSGVVEPPLTRLVQQRQRGQPADPLVGRRRYLRPRWTVAQPEGGHRLDQRLRPRCGEVDPQPELERQHVADGDRTAGGDRRAVDGPAWVDEHATVGQLGQQVLDGVVEPQPALLDEE